jgi:hypothetical protein
VYVLPLWLRVTFHGSASWYQSLATSAVGATIGAAPASGRKSTRTLPPPSIEIETIGTVSPSVDSEPIVPVVSAPLLAVGLNHV